VRLVQKGRSRDRTPYSTTELSDPYHKKENHQPSSSLWQFYFFSVCIIIISTMMKVISLVLALCVLSGSSSAFAPPVAPAAAAAKQSALFSTVGAGETRIEGQTMRTWKVDRDSTKIHVQLKTNWRPSHCEVNLWHGPDYSPTNMKIYLENGKTYPLSLVLKPKGLGLDTIQVLNTASQEFPMTASVQQQGGTQNTGFFKAPEELKSLSTPRLIQGAGDVEAFPLPTSANKIQVHIEAAEGQRNVKFKMELLQGPNNVKQSIEFYASTAYKTPFYAVFTTPGVGYTVRIVNEYPLEFPMYAYVEPYSD
jgi:hypothetical protein